MLRRVQLLLSLVLQLEHVPLLERNDLGFTLPLLLSVVHGYGSTCSQEKNDDDAGSAAQ